MRLEVEVVVVVVVVDGPGRKDIIFFSENIHLGWLDAPEGS